MIHCLFFSGILRTGKAPPDSTARLGYCAAKDISFVGYRVSIITTQKVQAIVDFYLTPANRADGDAFPPLLWSMESHDILAYLKTIYGDNAYATENNANWLSYFEIVNKFHTKKETGKHPKSPRTARRKSRIRSKVEGVFGILTENYAFGRTRVRTEANVKRETALIFSAWNFFILIAYILNKFEDRLSLKRLLYKTK
jgi:hypothetical protein